ncbi:Endoplasmic reticulum resident protein 44 [Chelonia mydas]|uniref:Endoplasmic reticulum resident protein 44 n=1 Tax=Chelonia mydas TaxID=8469 RepID=M7B7K6_CHEMY|nr:Endoplasmic reticulum resident protein 44 [Chelonia mydas]
MVPFSATPREVPAPQGPEVTQVCGDTQEDLDENNQQHLTSSSSRDKAVADNADVALVNFYADWCRFSQMLHPIFEEASNVIKEEYPDKNQVVFARVDCDQHLRACTVKSSSSLGTSAESSTDYISTGLHTNNILGDIRPALSLSTSAESSTDYISTGLHTDNILGDIRPALPLNPRLSTGSRVCWGHSFYCIILHCAFGTFWLCHRAARLVGTTDRTAQASDCGVEADTRPGMKGSLEVGASFGNVIVLVADHIVKFGTTLSLSADAEAWGISTE